MGLTAMAFLADVLVMACFVYIATRIVFLDARFSTLLAIIMIVALITLIPYVGWILGACVFVYLLMSVTGASLLRCIAVVVAARLLSFAVVFFILRSGAATGAV